MSNRAHNPDPQGYLLTCPIIDFRQPAVLAQAAELAAESIEQAAANCFHFVRDEIKHSSDFQLNPVTCKASEVLEHRTGYCYAKSHLLCGLLRANGIPAGLCYQRLCVDGNGPPLCLHGLVAVHLPEHGWYRIDPRGNRADVDAQFSPPVERLAFEARLPGELDCSQVYVEPLLRVVEALQRHDTWDALHADLPDSQWI
ncbi:MAG: transglutaminase family protein [Planctomycetales bacterium]|nr:transglutaminase family protein [Planctomycetales bacterium]